jgi:uncharacterized membrane protein
LANKTSQHILNTSATLLVFCLFIITSLHFANQTDNTWIDEFTSVVALLLTVSCIFSFVSIRSTNEEREYALEKIADYFFLFSLVSIMGVIAFIIIKFWR